MGLPGGEERLGDHRSDGEALADGDDEARVGLRVAHVRREAVLHDPAGDPLALG